MRDLPTPSFFKPQTAFDWSFQPDVGELQRLAPGWRRKHRIRPAHGDRLRAHLLLVDVQRDFCFSQGTLFVAGRDGVGASADNERIARFIYRNLENLSLITVTLDSHLPQQIFFAPFWRDRRGHPLEPHREISAEEIRDGAVAPNPELATWLCGGEEDWLRHQVLFYCEELERRGKYSLYLWPPHCLLGSDGHALVGAVQQARLFHSFVRGAPSPVEIKGNHPLTENYSVFAPEVLERHDGGRLAARNERLIEELLGADLLIVAGQAASHCVMSSVDDLLAEVERRDRSLAGKVYLLEDCMSSVVVRDAVDGEKVLFDFTTRFEEAKERWRAAGVRITRSDRPMKEWS